MSFPHRIRNDGVDEEVKRELRGAEKVENGEHQRIIKDIFIRKWKPVGQSILQTKWKAANSVH